MSPLQFQKQLRLQEARLLLLGDEVDVARAGYRVGYDDPPHFNREYKKLFGEPPERDMERLHSVAAGNARDTPCGGSVLPTGGARELLLAAHNWGTSNVKRTH